MIKRSLCWLLFMLAAFSVTAQSEEGDSGDLELSLDQAIELALKNNKQVQNSAIDVDIARQKIKETRGIGLPQINGEVKYQNFIDIPTQVIPANAFNPNASGDVLVPLQFGTTNNASAALNGSQLIFSGSYIVGLQTAATYRKFAEQNLEKTEKDVRELVSQTYYSLLVAEENKRILSSSLKNLEKTLEETRALYQNGFIEKLDVDQMKLSVASMHTNLNKLSSQVKNIYDLLKFHMGIEQGKGITLSDSLSTLTSATTPGLVEEKAEVSDHIKFRLADSQVSLMRLNLKNERYSRFPTVGGFVTHSQNAFNNEFKFDTWYPTTIWGININVPIFSGFMSSARVSQAKMELVKAENNRELANQSIQLQVQTAKSNYRIAYETLENEKKNLSLAKDILDKTITKYKEGLASSMEVTQANNQLLTAQGSYANALFDLLNAKTQLQKALDKY